MYQQAAWIISLLLIVFLIFVFLFVLSKSGNRTDYTKIQKKGYFLRAIWFVILSTGLITAVYLTIQDLPFERVEAKGEPVHVNVTAMQFGFEVSKNEFKVGDYVAFHVTSKDVNHGFGLYDENLSIVTQTQAMPTYTNTVYYQFKKPGTYTILCLEYCGIAHHIMKNEITVTE